MEKKEIKTRQEKDKIVEAHPGVAFFSDIEIKEKEARINIGGFTIDGGFYLRSPYELVKTEVKENLGGWDLTYYNFVKSSKKMCEQERKLRQMENKKVKWKRDREKELKKELESIEKEKEGKSALKKGAGEMNGK